MSVPISVLNVIASNFMTFVDNHTNSHSPFNDKQGAVFTVRIDHDFYGCDKDGNHHPEWEGHSHQFCHIIILAGRRVFFACENDEKGRAIHRWQNIPLNKWLNTSNHDSCWKTDGFVALEEAFDQSFETAYQNAPEAYRPRYDEGHVMLGDGMGHGSVMQFVEIEDVSKDIGSRHTMITGIKQLKVSLSISE